MAARRLFVLLSLLAAWPAFAVQAAMQLADNGSSGPPIISLSTGTGQNTNSSADAQTNGMLDLLQQMQDLKQRIESLQNQLEIQDHELKQLRSQQRDFFSDVDSRLSAMKSSQPGSASPTAVPVTPTTQVVSPAVLAHSPQTQKDYDHAFNLLRAGHYQSAITAFQAFLKAHGGSQLADNAHYWIAETYYVLGQYRHALPEFRIVVRHYPNSAKVPDSLLKIGYIENRLGLPAKAERNWRTLVNRYPDSSSAALARKRLQSLRNP